MKCYFDALIKYADFHGRARRAEYWTYTLVSTVIAVILYVQSPASPVGTIPLELYSVVVLLPSIAVGVRRLHDTNHSGWWLLAGLVPVIGTLALIPVLAAKGTPGRNKYGLDPLGADSTCPHNSLLPHWDLDVDDTDAYLVGELLEFEDEADLPVRRSEQLNRFVCEACGETFPPEEAAAIREGATAQALVRS